MTDAWYKANADNDTATMKSASSKAATIRANAAKGMYDNSGDTKVVDTDQEAKVLEKGYITASEWRDSVNTVKNTYNIS